MSVFGRDYAKYYDLLYKDKDYKGEIDYIDALIKQNSVNHAKSVLDIGCGTGRHLKYFKELGYDIAGIDQSEKMIESAQINLGADAMLYCAGAADFKTETKFDAAISLFHVMSYLNSNEEIEKTLKNINQHLIEGGLFIFDYWYGPSVLSELPSSRINRFENNELAIIRQSTPTMNYEQNCVNVNFEVDIKDKSAEKSYHTTELHRMRYFFIPEIEYFLSKCGFSTVASFAWMTQSRPVNNQWYAVSVARKK